MTVLNTCGLPTQKASYSIYFNPEDQDRDFIVKNFKLIASLTFCTFLNILQDHLHQPLTSH